jgi:hypothetical protein
MFDLVSFGKNNIPSYIYTGPYDDLDEQYSGTFLEQIENQ